MRKRHQDLLRVGFCATKSILALSALVPQYCAELIRMTEQPLESTRWLAFIFLLLDSFALRFLFHEDLVARKGQASLRISTWSFPTAALLCLASVGATFVMLILMGAPALHDWMETLHVAIMLTVMCFWPFCLLFSQPLDEFLKVASLDGDIGLERGCLIPGLLAVVGAWCSSVVYPLDWDRPWQKWPIPSCVGACAGYHVGYMALAIWICLRMRRTTPRYTLSKVE